MRRINKKGAIEITATAIVVFIIAIVVLGAVIYFVQSFFPDVFSLVGTQLEQTKQKLRAQVVPGEKIAFDFGSELKLKSGEKKEVYLGLQNDYTNPSPDKDSICYRVGIKCIKPFNKESCTEGENDIYVGGADSQGTTYKTWFGSANLLKGWDIRNNDFDVQGPISVQARVASDTYLMKVEVYKAQDDASCSGNPSFEAKPYATKQFRLIVQ